MKLPERDIDSFYSTVGRKIRHSRVRAEMSQAMLARRIGFTRSSVANLEAGRQHIGLHLFVLIAQALGQQPAELLPAEPFGAAPEILKSLNRHLSGESDTSREFVREAVAQLVADPSEEAR